MVRNLKNAETRFKNIINNKFLTIIEHDVCDSCNIDYDIDFIIHAASQASPKYYGTDPIGTLNANVIGTINLIKLAQQKNIKSFLYFSSSEVYGNFSEANVSIREDTFGSLNPALIRSCYAESKRMGENICVSWHFKHNLPIKIVRPFHTYGPGLKLDDGRVFADFISSVINKENIYLKSDGSAKRCFCYITDATLGFLDVLVNGQNGQAYNIGNPNEEYSILELANIVVASRADLKLKVLVEAQKDDLSYIKSEVLSNKPNIEKMKALGWNPNITVKEGFKRTIDYLLLEKKSN
jgi:nucleoside-diphosphate-sugar epimerase